MSFQISYENPKRTVPGREEYYEEYDLESAFYDFVPSGARATLALDGYVLEMPELKLVNLARTSLLLAERLCSLPPDTPGEVRAFLPELPPGLKIYYCIFPDFILWLPVLIFVTDGANIQIYTRTSAEGVEGFQLIVWEERDRADPVVVPHGVVIEEIRSFLTRYLDDVVAAFPFLLTDEKHQEYRARLAALRA